MDFELRAATPDDEVEIGELIAASVRGLAKNIYTDEQIELSIRTVFGIDHQLISDGTYYVAIDPTGKIVGCGGWSKRRTLFGASRYEDARDPELLDPASEAAKIRAFFIHPDAARRGIGSAILDRCESEARTHGFSAAEMMATLPGIPLYSARGYSGDERIEISLESGSSIDCVKMSKRLE